MNVQELVDKMDWEGGIHGLMAYGVKPSEIDDNEIAAAFEHVLPLYIAYEQAAMDLEVLIEGKMIEADES